ncbi:MAG: tail fiber protein [Flavipsychrobacter sp.]
MTDGTLGEIRIVAYNFTPQNWAVCYGQYLPINTNQALYAVLGTIYGGNGFTEFQLPDFRGRVPIQFGQGVGQPNYNLGNRGGELFHQLTIEETPAHKHTMTAQISMAGNVKSSSDDSSNVDDPTNANPSLGLKMYSDSAADVAMGTSPVTVSGSMSMETAGLSNTHLNVQPFVTMNYVICVQGLFPTRN